MFGRTTELSFYAYDFAVGVTRRRSPICSVSARVVIESAVTGGIVGRISKARERRTFLSVVQFLSVE